MDDTNPILKHVQEARRLGEMGEYDACLRSYSSARDFAQQEIKSCRSKVEMTKWNALIKDIGAEEVQIRRLRTMYNDIMKEISLEETRNQLEKDRGDRLTSRPEFSTNTNVRHPRRVEFPKPVHKAPKRKSVQQKPIREAKAAKPKTSQSPRHKDKPKMQPSENPLMQQIVDSGILIKDPDVSWDAIAGLDDVKKLLRQNLVILPMRPDIAHGVLSPWKSVLFYGPPGTGKTFLAKAIATECRRTFFNVTSATITSKFLGETEKLISYLFDLADEMAPSTIFFDEIDTLGSQRGAADESETARRMKAQLLTKMDGIDASGRGFVLAATNFPWDLDEALLRRFQKRVYIPLPDIDARRELLIMNLEDLVDEEFSVDMWAERLDGYSCADITNLCIDAAQMVFEKQMEHVDTHQWINMPLDEAQVIVTNEDFAWAVARRKSSVDLSMIKRYEEWRRSKGAE